MQRILCLFLVLTSVYCYGQPLPKLEPSTAIRGHDGTNWVPVKVTPAGKLDVQGDIGLATSSLDNIRSYEDNAGNPVRGKVDTEKRPMVNLASDGIGLLDLLEEIKEANASDTKLIAAIWLVEAAINGLVLPDVDSGKAKVSLEIENIGLLNALSDIKEASASDTKLIAAINAVTTRLGQALPSGENKIGTVDIASELPAGTKKIGSVDIDSKLPAGDNIIGKVQLDGSVPGGINSIGTVGLDAETIGLIAALEAIRDANASETALVAAIDAVVTRLGQPLPAGTNSIGTVGLDSGTNTIGAVNLNVGSNKIGSVDIDSALPSGTNHIGEVSVKQGIPPTITKKSLSANASAAINPVVGQYYVMVQNRSETTSVWLGLANPAVVEGATIEVYPKGHVLLPDLSGADTVYCVASEAVDITVVQGVR